MKTRCRFPRRSVLRLEQLERRDAPATLVGNNKVTYQDVDGDNVTVTLSKPILNAGNVNSIVTFDTGTVDGSNATKQQLRLINLTSLGAAATGVGIITSAVRSPVNGGDGFAALGHIDATNIDLGAVTIDGDLGRILAGDATTKTTGLAGLTVQSLGRFGTSTGAPDLSTVIKGKLDFLRVKSDVKEAEFTVIGFLDGRIGSIFIGGSLIGGAGFGSGRIQSSGAMGPVRIGGNIQGGSADNSGEIDSSGTLAGVTIGGSLIGAGFNSGRITSQDAMGPVRIGGNVQGGSGSWSGQIYSFSTLAGVTIGGNVQGGSADKSGAIFSSSTPAGVTIGGSLLGGTGDESGRIFSFGAIGPVRIGGNIQGGSADNSGEIDSSGTLAGVTIGGSLIGGAGTWSGRIHSLGAMAPVRIGGNVQGADGNNSGQVFSESTLAGVTIGGSLLGGAGVNSGRITSQDAMGPVRIGGNVQGRGGMGSGQIRSFSTLAGVSIGGSVLGGDGMSSGLITSGGAMGAVRINGSVQGGGGIFSGEIFSDGTLAGVTIGGDVVGGSASGAANLEGSGYIRAKRIAALTIGGSLIAGADNTTGAFANNGAIRVVDDIGSILIGNIIGNSTNPAIISARGSAAPTATTDLAIGSLRVRGRVEFARILAGFDVNGNAVNADAQIGAVTVGGDWIASSIAAGATPGANGHFGDGDDAKMSGGGVKDEATVSSQIKSLTIAGQAMGTVGGADHFGVVAENVGAVRIGGTPLVLTLGNGNDDFAVGITGDFKVNEI